jgi:hypothetical protein
MIIECKKRQQGKHASCNSASMHHVDEISMAIAPSSMPYDHTHIYTYESSMLGCVTINHRMTNNIDYSRLKERRLCHRRVRCTSNIQHHTFEPTTCLAFMFYLCFHLFYIGLMYCMASICLYAYRQMALGEQAEAKALITHSFSSIYIIITHPTPSQPTIHINITHHTSHSAVLSTPGITSRLLLQLITPAVTD